MTKEELAKLYQIRDILQSIREPMVVYRTDPLEFSRAAHKAKDQLADEALSIIYTLFPHAGG